MNKKLNGGTFGGILVTLLIVAIIVIVLIKLGILSFDGLGNGGDGEALEAMQHTVLESTEETTELTTIEVTPFNVKIEGDDYRYNDEKHSLDEIIEEIGKIDGDVEVHIYLDDTATLAAREALESKLKENGINPIVE